MPKAAKIERTQKLFLKAMKEKFMKDPDKNSWSKTGVEMEVSKDDHCNLVPYVRKL